MKAAQIFLRKVEHSYILHCEHCGAKLDPKKVIWLELDQRTNTYTDQSVPEEDSQGYFSFGIGCAKTILKRGGINHVRLQTNRI